jgi:hypothetical protein
MASLQPVRSSVLFLAWRAGLPGFGKGTELDELGEGGVRLRVWRR